MYSLNSKRKGIGFNKKKAEALIKKAEALIKKASLVSDNSEK